MTQDETENLNRSTTGDCTSNQKPPINQDHLKLLHSKKNQNQKQKDNQLNGRCYFANNSSDKELISKIYEELIKLNTKGFN